MALGISQAMDAAGNRVLKATTYVCVESFNSNDGQCHRGYKLRSDHPTVGLWSHFFDPMASPTTSTAHSASSSPVGTPNTSTSEAVHASHPPTPQGEGSRREYGITPSDPRPFRERQDVLLFGVSGHTRHHLIRCV